MSVPRSISLRTEIPGPRSHEILARRDAAVAGGLYRAHPIAIDHAEGAVKIARAATGRPAIVAFEGAYHGRTLMTLSLTSKYAFKRPLGRSCRKSTARRFPTPTAWA